MKRLELVLPCYNEEKSIERLVSKTIEAARKAGYSANDFGIVLVNNGSTDNSLSVFESLKEQDAYNEWINVVHVPTNLGYGHGLYQGLKKTSAEAVSWSHADEQCDPSDVFRAMEVYTQSDTKNILIKGNRLGRDIKDRIVSRVFEAIASLVLRQKFHEINAQPKLFPQSALRLCENPPSDFSFDLYFLYQTGKNGFLIKEIDVQFPPRIHGFSNWSHGLKNRSRHIKNTIKYIFKLASSEGHL